MLKNLRESYPVHAMPLSQAECRETDPVCKSCRIIASILETEGLYPMIFTPARKLSGIVETRSKNEAEAIAVKIQDFKRIRTSYLSYHP